MTNQQTSQQALDHATQVGTVGRDVTIIHNYNRPVSRPDETDNSSPYQGLSHFGPADAEFFFGRDAFIGELIERLDRQSFIPVLGASGSGKSSVVLAGLAPKLGESGQWHITHFQPGDKPFRALALALVPLYKPGLDDLERIEETNKLESKLKAGKVHLSHLVEMIQTKHTGSQTLLIADQFEELFSLCPDEEVRRNFLQMLTEASRSPAAPEKAPLIIVATMRADFLGQALEYPALAEVLTHDIKLKPMSRAELQAAIEKPVERINETQQLKVSFEPGLVDQILDDVERRVGNLPLLEFALALLWEARRQGGDDAPLTVESYEELGKVEGALAQHANQVYERLSEAEQEQVQYIFTHYMIQPGEGTGDTRRIASRSEVGEENWPVIRKLADARLIEIHPPNEAGEDTAEVVHEALIHNWDRIGEWVNQIRAFLVWQKQLRFALKRWQDTGQDEGALLRGALLKEAEAWLAEREADLRQEERNFIQTSVEVEKESRRDLLALEIRAEGAIGQDMEGVDLSGADLNGANLSGSNLRRANLRRAYLRGANLSEADLTGANLKGANLMEADLREAVINDDTQLDDKWRLVWEIVTKGAGDRDLREFDLNNANLIEANLSGTDLSGASLNGAYLIWADLRGTNLSGADLSEANLNDADLTEANLSGADLSGADLSEADLRGANLSEADLSGVDLTRAKISHNTKLDDRWRLVWEIVTHGAQGRDLSGANLSGANLSGANLNGASLWKANLSGASLNGANLRRANLWKTNLSGADLRWADLHHADLSGSVVKDNTKLDDKWRLVWEIVTYGAKGRDLSKADLSGTNLSRTNLRSWVNLMTDLREVNLSEADLRDTNLHEVNLSGANLGGANLRRARLRGANLSRAKYTESTRWPNDFDPVEAGAVKVEE